MSQMVTRKGPVGEDKEKGQSADTPVKEMKKKMAANAEKEKQAAEKHGDKDKEKDKPAETKQSEKAEKNVEKNSDKKEKQAEKVSEKKEKQAEKATEKKEKQAEKEKLDKSTDKKTEAPAEKPKEDKNAKPDKPAEKDNKEPTKEKDKKPEQATPTPTQQTPKPKQNGSGSRANGTAATNGNDNDSEDTVSSDEELVIIDHERDDMFPELAYEDSDGEFEPPTPEGLPSRSYTRRSQAKAARTPETPRPNSDKRANDIDDSKESKVLKLKEDIPSTDRKLRSSDSPKPESKKEKKTVEKEKDIAKEAEGTKTDKQSPKKKDLEVPEGKDDEAKDKSTVEVIDVDIDEGADSVGGGGGVGAGAGAGRKEGTNYSRSRVKVSPYRRADHTASSVAANYTGNNTTMEMDITESSSLIDDASTPTQSIDSPYLSGLRSIRGRRSYKPLKEMALRNVSVSRSVRSTTSVVVTEQPQRPTAPVVGRKRKPEGGGPVELAREALEGAPPSGSTAGKRARLLDKLARPFRAVSTPIPVRRNAEIVGINTDLPLTAPVAAPDTFDPESLKASDTPPEASPTTLPGLTGPGLRDNKRCVVM